MEQWKKDICAIFQFTYYLTDIKWLHNFSPYFLQIMKVMRVYLHSSYQIKFGKKGVAFSCV